ncbi:MAG: pyridoxal phosphate-dependent aminotransferase [Pseudomonadota bacterium]
MNEAETPFTALVRSLPSSIPFVGPEAIERRRGSPFEVRVGANESAFGVSPKAAEAMREAVVNIAWYGDPEGYDLRAAIAAHHGVTMERVCLAGGVDELLGLTVRMLVEPGAPVITSLGAYPTFNYHVDGFGGELIKVPYRDDHIDLAAVQAAAHEHGAPLVYLANPDNPMGTWHSAAAVRDFISGLPEQTVLILDEAYIEFAPDGTTWPLTEDDPRVIRMRTFSKAHGMAGARIGYAVAEPHLIVGFNKIRNHFGVNRLAMAGALASLQDTDFVSRVAMEVARGRDDYYALARQHNLASLPSATNFVAIDMGGDGERARRMLACLEQLGVFVRMPGIAPMDRCIRISVGVESERALLAERFSDAFKKL